MQKNKDKSKKVKLAGMSILMLLLAYSVFTAFIKPFFWAAGEPIMKMVSGTEYISGEEGQVIIRLSDSNGYPIENAQCWSTVLYPDKSYFFIDSDMSDTSVPGNYYTSFMTPELAGVYEEHNTCNITHNGKSRILKVSSSFHVSEGLNTIVDVSRSQRTQYNDLVIRINNTYNELNSRIEMLSSQQDSKYSELSSRLNETHDDFTVQLQQISQQQNENYMDILTNVSSKYEEINLDISEMNESLRQLDQLNQTIQKKFTNFISAFATATRSMSDVLENSQP